MNFALDPPLFGQRLRHFRKAAGLTLSELGGAVDRSPSYLSQVENGRREPALSLVNQLAAALAVDASELLAARPPSRRAELELAVRRAQDDALYRSLGLPRLTPSARTPDVVLEHVVRLYEELRARQQVRAATPEEARRANAALRGEMRERGNHFPEIERLAVEALEAVGYEGQAPLSPRTLTELAAHYGFRIAPVDDLPASVRSLTDLRNRCIYIPQRNELDAQVARSVIFQTLGHFVLGHSDPASFAEFLRQRVEANYFAGAVLMPEWAAVASLRQAQSEHDLSVEDFAEHFYVSYEMAAHRFTNLATRHLGIPTHFLRSDEQGVIWKAYENDGVPFPTDPDGAIEGQRLCRHWGVRQVFRSAQRYAMHYQYTDTPSGTFWCATYLEAGREPHHAVTVGAAFAQAKHFRGRDTRARAVSACPDGPCCRRPPEDLAARWQGLAWPAPRPHSHVLAALPAGTFPGVDLTEAYEFLESHAPAARRPG